MTPKISVIIPVYNVEQYLEQCLESICAQTLKDIEIICINDGSTDGSLKILESYAKKDKRFIILDQANRGQSCARNSALNIVSAPYIVFIDSDDYIDNTYLEDFISNLTDINTIINTNVIFTYKDNACRYNLQRQRHGNFTLSQSNMNILDFFVYNVIFRSDIINKYHIRFLENKICEDAHFLFSYLVFAPNICLIESSAYHYRQHDASTTGKLALQQIVSMDRIYAFLQIYNWYKQYDFINTYGLPFQILTELYPFHKNADIFFYNAKKLIRDLGISQNLIEQDKTMSIFMKSKDINQFFKLSNRNNDLKCKRYFRLRISKKWIIIILFGIVIFDSKKNDA